MRGDAGFRLAAGQRCCARLRQRPERSTTYSSTTRRCSAPTPTRLQRGDDVRLLRGQGGQGPHRTEDAGRAGAGDKFLDIFSSPPTKFSKTDHLANTITQVQQVKGGRWVLVKDNLMI
jgi:hypothetical protein